MLERVRRSMQSGFTYILIAGLVVIFMFFFGMPSQTCSGAAGRQRAHLADVGGESIYTGDVSLLYNRFYGSDRTDEEDKYRQRRAQALRNLILIKLFSQRAKQEGFRVSTDELKDYITDAVRNVEYRYRYGRKGTFNGQYYKAYIQNRLRTQIEKYEAFKRQELLARKYLAAGATQGVVSEVERDRAETIKNTEMNLSFVPLDAERVRDAVEVEEEAIQTFLEENRDRVEKYYKDNKPEKYSEPAQIRLRRIFIDRPGQSAEDSEKKRAEQKWKEAKNRVQESGEDFATVASELSEGYASDKGGMMDWKTKDTVEDAVLEALKDAESGDVREVVTDKSYRLVKLEGRKEAETTPLEEVESDIAKTLLQKDRADKFVSEIKTKLHETAKKKGSLTKALEQLRSESDRAIWEELSVEETGTFTLEAQGPPPQLAGQMGGRMAGMGSSWFEIPSIGESKKLAVDAFKNLSPDAPVAEDVYEVDGTNYIVRLASRSTPEGESDGGDEGSDGESGDEPSVTQALESKKASELVGRWSAIFGTLNGRFVPPMNEYGPWIDRQLERAVDEGTVELYPKRSKVAQTLNQSFKAGGDTPQNLKGGPAGKQKKKKGSPIQLKMGGKKGKGKGKGKARKISPEQLKKLKKQLKQKAKKAPEGAEGSDGPPAESGGTPEEGGESE